MIVTGTQVAVSVAASLAGADIFWFFIFGGKSRVVARVRDQDGKRLPVVRKDLDRVRLARSADPDDWTLMVPYRPVEKIGFFTTRGKGKRETAQLSGPVAMRAAGHILPKVNSWGGTETQVREAVTLIEEARAPERLFARVASEARPTKVFGSDARISTVKKLDANVRLALEMAAHEESERRALEGELALLEQAWREAEEIAAIADRLLIPESVEQWITRQRRKLTGA